MSVPLAFIDCETTGLDPDLHEIWDLALILRRDGEDIEQVWQLPVHLERADLIALNIGGFNERRWPESHVGDVKPYLGYRSDAEHQQTCRWDQMKDFARKFSQLTWGAYLVGAVPSFDEERLRRLLRRHGACPGWNYHLVDVEALAAGKLGIEPPWDSRELSSKAGVQREDYPAHTALGDARWARDLYDAVMRPAG